MAYRLRIDDPGGEKRFPLRPGENLVGSRPGCDVRIDHPSVSRDHAVIVWGDERLSIADLGSSNGTFAGGDRLEGSLEPSLPCELTFGTVQVLLEQLEDADAEPARVGGWTSAAPDTHPPARGSSPRTSDLRLGDPRGTASVGPVPRFTLGHLPPLLSALRDGRRRAEMAILVGEALRQTVPCRGLEIVARSMPDDAAVLFRWGSLDEDCEVVGDDEDVEITVGLSSVSEAALLRPMLRAALDLVLLAPTSGQSTEVKARRQRREALLQEGTPSSPLPSPPTLDPRVREIYRQAEVVARSDVHVLIRGESGTGKEVLARFLHGSTLSEERPFVTLNCAALPRDLLESELFGIDKDVATGVAARAGKFEMAHGGTLFLDEIGDMAPETQAKILRVLQEGEVLRIGSHRPRPAQVRVVSATNRDLETMRREGSFRNDLYHRIADWVVELPPLRERRADIPQLAAHFLDLESRRIGRSVAGLSRGTVDTLLAYDWPGNIRELEREIRRAVLFVGDGELLDTSRLSEGVLSATVGAGIGLQEQMNRVERRLIEATIGAAEGDLPRAAEILEISVSTLYRKLNKLGIDPPD